MSNWLYICTALGALFIALSKRYSEKLHSSKSNESNARYIIIVGEEEYKLKKYTLKNLQDGNQSILNFSELLNKIKNG